LLAALDPTAGNNGAAPGLSWALGAAVSVTVLGIIVGAGLRGHGGARAALLGVATGVTFGLTAAFMKGMTAAFRGGVIGVLSAWQTYAMVAAGLAGMFLMQNALHAGSLVVAQPGITLADPALAIVWGVVIFHESTRAGIFVVGAVVAAAVMAAGVIVLARSPALEPGAADGSDAEQGATDSSPGDGDETRHEKDGLRARTYPRRVSASPT
ncbi:MAG TPA: DMT family transporter, partial [Acidimicrobiales bacterium]|nr:DMT family transporter [Acidimicrobiales bacterium]